MSNKLSHLQELIERINEKYTLSEEEKIKKNRNYLINNYFFISKKNLHDLLHNKKIENLLWNEMIENESLKKIIISYDENKNIKYIGFLTEEIKNSRRIKDEEFNLDIKVNNSNSYVLIHNNKCLNEVAIEQAIYEFNKLLNKSEFSKINLKELF